MLENRMTVKSVITDGYTLIAGCTIGRDGEPTDELGCCELCESVDCRCDNCPIQRALDMLAAYENTGLTPEEIIALKGESNEREKDTTHS